MSSSSLPKPPGGILETTIDNFSEVGTTTCTGQEKLELLGTAVFDLRYSKTAKEEEDDSACFSLYLRCTPKTLRRKTGDQRTWGQSYAVEFELQILRSDGTALFSRRAIKHIFCQEEPDWGYKNFIDLKRLLHPANTYVVDNQVKVAANIIAITLSKITWEQMKVMNAEVVPPKLLETFLESEIGADVCFIANDDGKVMAHSGILIAVSPVFKALLPSQKIIEEDTMSQVSIRTFLKCIYTGSLSHLFWVGLSVLKDVVMAAEKYQMQGLKHGVGVFLLDHIFPRNAVHLLHFAKKYKLLEVETWIRDYVQKNLNCVLDNTIPPDPDVNMDE